MMVNCRNVMIEVRKGKYDDGEGGELTGGE